jgi:hypothetical protein
MVKKLSGTKQGPAQWVDVFLDTQLDPDELTNFIDKMIKSKTLVLKTILNQDKLYQCKFVPIDSSKDVKDSDILGLLKELGKHLEWVSVVKTKI